MKLRMFLAIASLLTASFASHTFASDSDDCSSLLKITTAYSRLLNEAGAEEITLEDLKHMLATSDFFTLITPGQSTKGPLIYALNRLKNESSSEQLDAELLKKKLFEIVTEALKNRQSSQSDNNNTKQKRKELPATKLLGDIYQFNGIRPLKGDNLVILPRGLSPNAGPAIFNLATAKTITSINAKAVGMLVGFMSVSPDNKMLATIFSQKNEIGIWDTTNQTLLHTIPFEKFTMASGELTPSKTHLIYSLDHAQQKTLIFNIMDGSQKSVHGRFLGLGPQGLSFIARKKLDLKEWNWKIVKYDLQGNEIAIANKEYNFQLSRFSEDGHFLWLEHTDYKTQSFSLVNLVTMNEVNTISAKGLNLEDLSYDGKRLILSNGEKIIVQKTDDHQLIHSIESNVLKNGLFIPSSDNIVVLDQFLNQETGHFAGDIWNLKTRTIIGSFKINASQSARNSPESISITPNGRFLIFVLNDHSKVMIVDLNAVIQGNSDE